MVVMPNFEDFISIPTIYWKVRLFYYYYVKILTLQVAVQYSHFHTHNKFNIHIVKENNTIRYLDLSPLEYLNNWIGSLHGNATKTFWSSTISLNPHIAILTPIGAP